MDGIGAAQPLHAVLFLFELSEGEFGPDDLTGYFIFDLAIGGNELGPFLGPGESEDLAKVRCSDVSPGSRIDGVRVPEPRRSIPHSIPGPFQRPAAPVGPPCIRVPHRGRVAHARLHPKP